MNYEISIGDYKLQTVEQVKVTSSILNLADIATIVIACPYSRKKEVIEKVKIGDSVEIKLGYENDIKTEFKGYLKSIQTEGDGVTLNCMDALYLLDKSIANKEYKQVTVKSLLSDVVRQVDSSFKVVSSYEFTYEKFTTMRTSALDVVKKVQDETKANIFFRDNTLYIQEPYKDTIGNTVIYDTAVNIETSELKYVTKEDKKVEVEVVFTKADGSKVTKTFGQKGGEKRTMVSSSGSEADMKRQGNAEYDLWNYDGFEGSFTGWLIPFTQAGDTVILRDEGKNEGKYYCIGVEVEFSGSGGKRKVTLGRKLL
jgi:hypothetical protein